MERGSCACDCLRPDISRLPYSGRPAARGPAACRGRPATAATREKPLCTAHGAGRPAG